MDVYLNKELIASHWNMYLPLSVNVSGRLREENMLVLHFHSVYDKSGGKRVRIRNVNGDPDRRVRRPNQNYSNYLGPYPNLSRVGVYDKIFLEVTHGSQITEVTAGTSLNEPLTIGTVTVDIGGTSRLDAVELRTNVLDPDGNVVVTSANRAEVAKGIFAGHIVMNIDRLRLWWPRGFGDQPLYRVEITLMAEGKPHQRVSRTLGFRRVTMPERLHFVVNGVPVCLWGGDRPGHLPPRGRAACQAAQTPLVLTCLTGPGREPKLARDHWQSKRPRPSSHVSLLSLVKKRLSREQQNSLPAIS